MTTSHEARIARAVEGSNVDPFVARLVIEFYLAGDVVVPKEATDKMIEAAYLRDDAEPCGSWGATQSAPFEEIYRAMVSAATETGG